MLRSDCVTFGAGIHGDNRFFHGDGKNFRYTSYVTNVYTIYPDTGINHNQPGFLDIWESPDGKGGYCSTVLQADEGNTWEVGYHELEIDHPPTVPSLP